MASEKPKTIHRQDYRAPDYRIDSVDLEFDLGEEVTEVRARLAIRRNELLSGDPPPLVLDGEDLEPRGIWLDGAPLPASRYHVGPEGLTIERVPARFELETRVAIRPQENTSLSGLYKTSGNFCTQCEAMGFRRITWFLDRPDVMARYRTTITADRSRYPVLLSNGNRVAREELDGGRHRVCWEDPFPKPSYLFALVAGDLRCHRGRFVTRSGREVALEIWVEPQNLDRCEHALRSLQKAMKWDEDRFGLEYDLDVYMIVAVNDFNMGAMENKGLNVFNSKYVLARPETATDADYEGIEGVIAHEYFHNWTGNRVTCRDWFQLTLKEGLTVYRDQRFSADMGSAAVKRIEDVKILRTSQFVEDAGPMSHPIRPESYISMDNFYTSTVYNKGAEVIRMYEALLGREGFRRGMDLYFERHDGQAVTCDDFRAAMADANDRDLEQFERWYEQAGTPELRGSGEWDAAAGRYTLTLAQSYPETHATTPRRPLHLPVAMGLLASDGRDLPLRLEGEERPAPGPGRVLELVEAEQRFCFVGLAERPVPSLLRGFSAPVRLRVQRDRAELAFLMSHDSDEFNRWDAGQELATGLLLDLTVRAAAREPLALDEDFSAAFGRVLDDRGLDGSLKALALALPSEKLVGQEMSVIDPDALHVAREFMRRELARAHREALLRVYEVEAKRCRPYRADRESIDARRLKNAVLAYLVALAEPETTARVWHQFETADNMTDGQAALELLVDVDGPEREAALSSFYERWHRDPLVLDKWFAVQALCQLPGTVDAVVRLVGHPDFSPRNPNRVRALVGNFCAGNPVHFHERDGRGYGFLADQVLALDPLNPLVAARMVSHFNSWRRFDAQRQERIREQLERIAGRPGISKDVYEIVGRALGD